MSDPLFGQFIDKKKANSEFLQLGDGETARIIGLREVKMLTKTDPAGNEKEVLRLVCDVQTPEGLRIKKFDNASQGFAVMLQEKGITIGSSFSITRTGLSLKTKYAISDVVNPAVGTTV